MSSFSRPLRPSRLLRVLLGLALMLALVTAAWGLLAGTAPLSGVAPSGPVVLRIGLVLLAVLILFNLLAFRHARAVTSFLMDDREPSPLQSLSLREKLDIMLNGARVSRPRLTHFPDAVLLPWEAHRYAADTGTLDAWNIPCAGARGTILMFHGYGVSKERLLPEAALLHRMGYSCFLVDFRGSGGSSGSTTTIGRREARDVVCSLEYVRERWPASGPVVLFGQSMGASAVLRAMTLPGVRADALILECPFNRLLNTIKARFRALGVPSFPLAHLLLFWASVQERFNGFTHNPASYARKVTTPALLMGGEQDPWVKVPELKEVRAALAGPSELVTFPGVGHESLAVAAPHRWKSTVQTFLERVLGRKSAPLEAVS